jgi:hypothetical protein
MIFFFLLSSIELVQVSEGKRYHFFNLEDSWQIPEDFDDEKDVYR